MLLLLMAEVVVGRAGRAMNSTKYLSAVTSENRVCCRSDEDMMCMGVVR